MWQRRQDWRRADRRVQTRAFKVYQRHYSDLASGNSFDIHPQFYKETGKSIESFLMTAKILKDYGCRPLKARMIWNKRSLVEVEIFGGSGEQR